MKNKKRCKRILMGSIGCLLWIFIFYNAGRDVKEIKKETKGMDRLINDVIKKMSENKKVVCSDVVEGRKSAIEVTYNALSVVTGINIIIVEEASQTQWQKGVTQVREKGEAIRGVCIQDTYEQGKGTLTMYIDLLMYDQHVDALAILEDHTLLLYTEELARKWNCME